MKDFFYQNVIDCYVDEINQKLDSEKSLYKLSDEIKKRKSSLLREIDDLKGQLSAIHNNIENDIESKATAFTAKTTQQEDYKNSDDAGWSDVGDWNDDVEQPYADPKTIQEYGGEKRYYKFLDNRSNIGDINSKLINAQKNFDGAEGDLSLCHTDLAQMNNEISELIAKKTVALGCVYSDLPPRCFSKFEEFFRNAINLYQFICKLPPLVTLIERGQYYKKFTSLKHYKHFLYLLTETQDSTVAMNLERITLANSQVSTAYTWLQNDSFQVTPVWLKEIQLQPLKNVSKLDDIPEQYHKGIKIYQRIDDMLSLAEKIKSIYIDFRKGYPLKIKSLITKISSVREEIRKNLSLLNLDALSTFSLQSLKSVPSAELVIKKYEALSDEKKLLIAKFHNNDDISWLYIILSHCRIFLAVPRIIDYSMYRHRDPEPLLGLWLMSRMLFITMFTSICKTSEALEVQKIKWSVFNILRDLLLFPLFSILDFIVTTSCSDALVESGLNKYKAVALFFLSAIVINYAKPCRHLIHTTVTEIDDNMRCFLDNDLSQLVDSISDIAVWFDNANTNTRLHPGDRCQTKPSI